MSAIHGVSVGGNLFDVSDSSNVAPYEPLDFASRPYAKDRFMLKADGLLYRAKVDIESGDPLVINGNIKRSSLDEIIANIETDSDLIAPTEDGATSSDDYTSGEQIVRSGILYEVIDDIAEGDAFVVGNNIQLAGSVSEQIGSLKEALTDLQDDLTDIKVTGTTNNTGSTITSGTYFYLNGALVVAKVDIANSATFTENTNYTVVSDGSLNALKNKVLVKKFDNPVVPSNISFELHPLEYITMSTNWEDLYSTHNYSWAIVGPDVLAVIPLGGRYNNELHVTFDNSSRHIFAKVDTAVSNYYGHIVLIKIQ